MQPAFASDAFFELSAAVASNDLLELSAAVASNDLFELSAVASDDLIELRRVCASNAFVVPLEVREGTSAQKYPFSKRAGESARPRCHKTCRA